MASLLGVLTQVQGLASAFVLAAFFSLAARGFVLLFIERGRGALVSLVRVLAGAAFLALGCLYAAFTAHVLVWDAGAAGVAAATGLLFLLGVGLRLAMKRPAQPPSLVSFLVQLVLLLSLLLLAAITLMRAGFLALSEDEAILLVDVTGETGVKAVRWAPPDRPPREERIETHRVIFRTPAGVRVAETWVYGDQVAVKGRVLRLSPLLNSAGVPNLFELQFAHNGYVTAARHDAYPHMAVELPPTGPLAVHPWWRPLQVRLLEGWEKRTAPDSPWAVRSVTTESTYYPLVDAAGRPVRQTFRLVLTPGGLSSS